MAELNSLALQNATGLTYRQGDWWCRAGLLVPAGGPHPGSGQGRRFSEREVWVASVLAELRRLGGTLDVLRRVASQLRLDDPAMVGTIYVGPEGWISHAPAPACWCIDLDSIPVGADGPTVPSR